VKKNAPTAAQLTKLLLKLPVTQRRAIIRRAKLKLVRDGRYEEKTA